MSSQSLGNKINQIIWDARASLFNQGELADLSYRALDTATKAVAELDQESIEIEYPIGWRADKTAISNKRVYQKDELQQRYRFLAFEQLPINGLVQLVTIVEAMLGDIVRAVVLKYPKKMGSKRTVSLEHVLEARSLEDVQVRAVDALLHDLSYRSPAEFSEAAKELISLNLLECPAFHCYMELKASRDIFIHNGGIANEIYVRKSGSHVRVRSGMRLPAGIEYFLESYESCLQLTEWLEEQLHEIWQSSDFDGRRARQLSLQLEQQTSAAPAPPPEN